MKIWPALFLLNTCLFTSCSFHQKTYVDFAHEMTARTAQEFHQEKGIILMGTGGGMIGKINHLSMVLVHIIPDKTTVDIIEARKLALYVIDKYLDNINADVLIRPYLKNHPFKTEHIDVLITFNYSDGTLPPVGYLKSMSIRKDKIFYIAKSSQTQRNFDLHEETISQARQKLTSQATSKKDSS